MGTERRRRRMRRSSPAGEAATGREIEATSGREIEATSGRETGATSGRETGAARGQEAGAADRATPVVAPRSPTPHDLAELGGTFAMTAAVADPDDEEPDGTEPVATGPEWAGDEPVGHGRTGDDPYGERGLRGLVGGGSSQVTVVAAMRARDAARPSEADLAAVEAELVIVRRGWVPREDLPPRGPRR